MLLFITFRSSRLAVSNGVSIHLMLLFIQAVSRDSSPSLPFQYISCYSLSLSRRNFHNRCIRFNTSHVTLYRAQLVVILFTGVFQYISCYSLSQRPVEKISPLHRFNTSHVTLYRKTTLNTIENGLSFNTSHVTLYHVAIYAENVCACRFNTSHVTLYRQRADALSQGTGCFNTSHVTLYRTMKKANHILFQVSIHLMLLFITVSLSSTLSPNVVSIHLMLLFILCIHHSRLSSHRFNTSHVTLYLHP